MPEESRLPMIWDERQDRSLLVFYQQLTRLRRREGSLRGGRRQILKAGADTLAYSREQDTPGVVTVLNLATEARRMTLAGDTRMTVRSP